MTIHPSLHAIHRSITLEQRVSASEQAKPATPRRRLDLAADLPQEAQLAFRKAAHRRRYHPGQTIYAKGDGGDEMYRVVSGDVRLSYLCEDGRELLHTLYRPGDYFGVLSLIDHDERPQMAEAVSETELDVIDRRAFEQLRRDHPSLDAALLLFLSVDIRSLIDRVNSINFEPLRSRIIRCLLRVARPDEAGVPTARISQAELATMVDASRQTVNQIVGEFERRKLIRKQYGVIFIINRQELERALISF